jgi:hypothetical protein
MTVYDIILLQELHDAIEPTVSLPLLSGSWHAAVGPRASFDMPLLYQYWAVCMSQILKLLAVLL